MLSCHETDLWPSLGLRPLFGHETLHSTTLTSELHQYTAQTYTVTALFAAIEYEFIWIFHVKDTVKPPKYSD